jgi:hypothetical protein
MYSMHLCGPCGVLCSGCMHVVVLGGLVVIVLAIRPKVREFNPSRERWGLKGDKNP